MSISKIIGVSVKKIVAGTKCISKTSEASIFKSVLTNSDDMVKISSKTVNNAVPKNSGKLSWWSKIKNLFTNYKSRPTTTNEKMAISLHHEMNGHNTDLRHFFENPNSRRFRNIETKEHYKNLIEKTDKEFSKLPKLDKEYVFYRGIQEGHSAIIGAKPTVKLLQNSTPGDIIIPDTAYAYTSYKKSIAEQFAGNCDKWSGKGVIMEIHTPKGAQISCNLEHGGEGLFPRSAQYKVISKHEEKNGLLNIIMEYILPKTSK